MPTSCRRCKKGRPGLEARPDGRSKPSRRYCARNFTLVTVTVRAWPDSAASGAALGWSKLPVTSTSFVTNVPRPTFLSVFAATSLRVLSTLLAPFCFTLVRKNVSPFDPGLRQPVNVRAFASAPFLPSFLSFADFASPDGCAWAPTSAALSTTAPNTAANVRFIVLVLLRQPGRMPGMSKSDTTRGTGPFITPERCNLEGENQRQRGWRLECAAGCCRLSPPLSS